MAKQLIDCAVYAGADIVKFQTFNTSELVTNTAKPANYQKAFLNKDDTQINMLKELQLSLNDFSELYQYCSLKGIQFLSTAFDISSINFLSSLELDLWKIPSGEITNLPYLREVAKRAKYIILSSGMCNYGDIESALSVLFSCGIKASHITLLHCTTEYPAPYDEVNLLALKSLSRCFGISVGYSDHTPGICVPIAAVALGATVIEKHLTLDKGLPGPDHRSSLEPGEFKSMVDSIRNVELSLGDGVKRVTPSESVNKALCRKSIVASCPIKRGDLFSSNNLTTKRPGSGISPMLWDSFIGQTATRNYATDEQL